MQRREFLQLMAASMVTPFTLTTDPLKAGSNKTAQRDFSMLTQLGRPER